MVNHGAITGWILAVCAMIGGVLYIGNLNGKLTSLENELRNTTQRVDGLYIFIAQQGKSVKQAIKASDLDPNTKNRLLNSIVPMYELKKENQKNRFTK